MGRLIDADELTEHMYREAIDTRTKVARLIKSAPTVEAIHIDWIESYAVLAEADGRPFFAEGIRDMVEEWKKEQKGN